MCQIFCTIKNKYIAESAGGGINLFGNAGKIKIGINRTLDNILIRGNEVTSCIDTGRAGLADKYQDLAILWDCLGEFSPVLQDRLFQTYGITTPYQRRLRFHLGLDELF